MNPRRREPQFISHPNAGPGAHLCPSHCVHTEERKEPLPWPPSWLLYPKQHGPHINTRGLARAVGLSARFLKPWHRGLQGLEAVAGGQTFNQE